MYLEEFLRRDRGSVTFSEKITALSAIFRKVYYLNPENPEDDSLLWALLEKASEFEQAGYFGKDGLADEIIASTPIVREEPALTQEELAEIARIRALGDRPS